ncbi:MAG: hypothetical protein ABEN55_13625 [Bradymonadaceae bacterium]
MTVTLVTEMLDIAGEVDDREATQERLEAMLEDGTALEKFREIIEAQDGDPTACDDPREVLATADHVEAFEAPTSGIIERIDAEEVGLASLALGAGRQTKDDEIDHAVGLVFRNKRGASVEQGEPILDIHYNDHSELEACKARLEEAIEVGEGPADEKPLVYETLSR